MQQSILLNAQTSESIIQELIKRLGSKTFSYTFLDPDNTITEHVSNLRLKPDIPHPILYGESCFIISLAGTKSIFVHPEKDDSVMFNFLEDESVVIVNRSNQKQFKLIILSGGKHASSS